MTFTIQDRRWPGDPDKLALVLPGRGYSPARPLLHFARTSLYAHGWTVQEIWWDPSEAPGQGEVRFDWARRHITEALAQESASRVLLVGKSLGTFGAEYAAEHALPAVWLTPLLKNERLVTALEKTTAPTLLIGGTADRHWDSEVAAKLGHSYLEFPGADHGLEIDDAAVPSAAILGRTSARIEEFLTALG